MPERNTIDRCSKPATIDSLAKELAALGVVPGSTLLVHSSLSALGWVCGGPVAVIEALQTAIGQDGTLVIPTHTTELSDPSCWSNPPVPAEWWPTIRANMPVFDPAISPTRMMGVIAESFRSQPAVLRSDHPHHSFAARGPRSAEIIDHHRLEDGLGEHSPLARLYESNAMVLLLGVGHEKNTSLHLSEVRGLREEIQYVMNAAPLMIDSQREWVKFQEPDYNSDNFATIGSVFESNTTCVQVGRVGLAEARLMSQRELVDFGATWISDNRIV